MLQLREEGYLDELKKKWWLGNSQCSNNDEDTKPSSSKVKINLTNLIWKSVKLSLKNNQSLILQNILFEDRSVPVPLSFLSVRVSFLSVLVSFLSVPVPFPFSFPFLAVSDLFRTVSVPFYSVPDPFPDRSRSISWPFQFPSRSFPFPFPFPYRSFSRSMPVPISFFFPFSYHIH